MLPDRVHFYLLTDLESAPDVLARLLADAAGPNRFTLREMAAHLADWEGVFLGRLTQTRDEENAVLHRLDEGQVARDNGYAHADPQECLTRYRTGARRSSPSCAACRRRGGRASGRTPRSARSRWRRRPC